MRTLIDLMSFVPNKIMCPNFYISLIESFKADKSHKKLLYVETRVSFFW